MKKQIIYAKLIPRIFASTIDLFILSIIATPITNFGSSYLFLFIFRDYFIKNQINLANNIDIAAAVRTPEFSQYITSGNSFTYFGLILLMNIFILGTYFIGFWIYKGATPGKMIMRLKIVDAITLEQPTNLQLIKRFCGYSTILFGIWFAAFSKQRQAMHDKMAGTVVIKS